MFAINPPRLLELSNKREGAYMYEPETDVQAKMRQLTCHELIHACSATLRLPAWLNEGLAFVTVDRCLGKRTIRLDTLDMLRRIQPKEPPPGYRELVRLEPELIAYHGVRGYGLVKSLEESVPGFLKRNLASPKLARLIEAEMARELSLSPADFWKVIDGKLVEHFEASD